MVHRLVEFDKPQDCDLKLTSTFCCDLSLLPMSLGRSISAFKSALRIATCVHHSEDGHDHAANERWGPILKS